MSVFAYESQGASTYLVYQIKPEDELDSMSLGMLTNNKIAGLAQTLFLQMDTTKYIKYNVSSKVSVKQFFSGVVNKKRLIGVFKGIVDGLMSAEDYMIDPSSIVMDMDYIFADVSTCEASLICLPILGAAGEQTDIRDFFKNIMFTTQFDQAENCDHVAKIINFLNASPVFSLADFRKLLEENKGAGTKSSARIQPPAQQKVSVENQQAFSVNPTEPSTPVFTPGPIPAQSMPSVAPSAPVRNERPASPAPATNEKKVGIMTLLMHYNKENVAAYKAQKEAKKAQANGMASPPISAQPPKASALSVGFVIPGQPSQEAKAMAAPVQATQASPASPVTADEKKVGMMTLLMHYNKENVAAYKAQKEAAKAQKAQTVSGSAKPAAGQSFTVPGAPVSSGSSMAPAQPSVAPQNRSASAPQNPQTTNPAFAAQTPVPQARPGNFGETTVLGGGAIGETTVLSAGMSMSQTAVPYLIRAKNNEKIMLNKPVFRIGKEKSYVDYFIGDNTAISRSHVNIVTRGDEYYVLDTNSTNHTFVNGEMIQSNVEIQISHGDKIRLANDEFEFKLY
ncbi:MAG: DUF6382 domain-containing protein [Oscillospiraceae bacterium]|nr:DUF6382 domain-containing protein [Oscillospiraceae bacterium]